MITKKEEMVWTKEKMINWLTENAEDGKAPSTVDHEAKGHIARKLFGSWENACQEAGVTPRSAERIEWSEERVIKNIKEHAQDGVAPSAKQYKKLYKAGVRYFGSWANACEEAGVTPKSKS